MKRLTIVLALVVLCGCANTDNAFTAEQEVGNTTLTKEDKHALELGRKIVRIKAALQIPEQQASVDAVTELGLDSRYYVMVRGWILQHINMTQSYLGTTTYKESEQRKSEIDDRIASLQKMLRAIDLE